MAIKAIFVGINKHLDTTIPELSGARRDAAALCAQFADNGDGMRVRLPVDDTFSRVKSVAFDRPKWPEEWLWTRLSQLTVAFLRFRSSCWSKCLTRKGLPWRSACSEDLGPRLIDTSFIECRHIPALHATIGGSQTLRYWNVVESTACRWASGTHPHRRRATTTAVTLHPARSRTQHIAAAIAAVPSRAAPTQNIGHPRAQTRPPGSARVVKTYGLAPSKTNHLPAVSGPS